MGREYSQLNSHSEAVISEIYRTKVYFLSTLMCLGSNKRLKKVYVGPAAQKAFFGVKTKEGEGPCRALQGPDHLNGS